MRAWCSRFLRNGECNNHTNRHPRTPKNVHETNASLLTVDFPAIPNLPNQHHEPGVMNLIHDAVIPTRSRFSERTSAQSRAAWR